MCCLIKSSTHLYTFTEKKEFNIKETFTFVGWREPCSWHPEFWSTVFSAVLNLHCRESRLDSGSASQSARKSRAKVLWELCKNAMTRLEFSQCPRVPAQFYRDVARVRERVASAKLILECCRTFWKFRPV